MKKIIDIDNEITTRLTRFSKEADFSVLLDAIEYALAKKRYTCDRFESAWDSFRDSNNLAELLEKFAPLLAKIESYAEKKDTASAKLPTDAEDNKVSELLEAVAKWDEHEDTLEKRFGWFTPTWALGDLLNSVYPEEINPVRVVKKHTDMLFPLSNYDYSKFTDDYTYNPVYKLPCGTSLHIFLKKLANDLIQGSAILEKYKQAAKNLVNSIFNSLTPELTTEKEVEEHFVAGLLLPRDIFFSWLYGASGLKTEREDFCCSPEMLPYTLKFFFSYFSIGQGNPPFIANNEIGYGSCLLPKELIKKLASEKVISYQTMGDLFDAVVTTYNGIEFDEELTVLMSKVLANFNNFRLTYLCGMSPINQYSSRHILEQINGSIPIEEVNLTIALSEGLYDLDSDINLFPDRGCAPPDTTKYWFDAYEKKKKVYFNLYRKAKNEGLPEFANALLSLYLMGRSIFCQCRMGNMVELKVLLDEATSIPGSMIVEHTIQTIISYIDEYFPLDPVAKMSGIALQNFIPKMASLYPLPTKKEDSQGEIGLAKKNEVKLIDELGEVCWNKLSEDSKKYLVGAQVQFERNAADLCFGIKDLSSFVLPYFKTIEKELIDRLEEFHKSQEYSDYCITVKRPKPFKPDLGWALNVLKDHKRFPEECRQKLYQAKLNTYETEKLVWVLKGLKDKDRNLSAHKDPYPMIKYSELMQSLFDDKILVKFISTLERVD